MRSRKYLGNSRLNVMHAQKMVTLNWRRGMGLVLGVLAILGLFGGTAFAYFIASGSGKASGTVGSLGIPTGPTATAASPNVTVSWGAAFLSNGSTFAQSYTVERYTGAGIDLGAACGGSSILSSSGTNSGAGNFHCTDTPGSGTFKYTITATYNSWTNTSGFTNSVTVSTTPTKLAFTTQPTSGQNIQATGTGTFSVSVAVEDTNGNVVTGDSRSITLSISNNPSSGVLSCTNTGGLTVAASSGVAAFSGCSITKVGTGYTLTASSSPTLTAPANANSFNITAGSASKLSVSAARTNPVAGATDALTITALDQNGNTATSYAGSKSLTFSGSSPIGTFNPTVSNNAATAVAFGTPENITFQGGVASPNTTAATGQAEMTLYKAGSASITVSDGTIGSSASPLAVNVDSAGVTLAFNPNPGNVAKNSMTTFTVSVPNDQYGNTFASLNGIVVNLSLSSTTNWGFGSSVGTGTKALTITSGPSGNTFSIAESGANKTAILSGTTTASGFTAPTNDSLASGS